MAIEPSRSSNVQDDYVLLEQIGQHAGKVFRAQHVREQRAVVVRIWRAPDKAARDRFVELARLARSVRHPVLPAIEAFGYHGDNACYVVTECARGEALDRWADRMGIPSVASAVELFQRVCVGLNAAHRNGLAHDTLHPRNLLVTESDSDPLMLLEPCVLDLGVPAAVRAFPPPLRTARFMAPEQLARAMRERALPTADVRMNVYSCGSLLHYLCTGGAPFLGRTLDEFAHAQAAGQLVPPSRINPQIPIALDAVIMRALAHDPSERFASMAELGHALERVRTGTSASGVRPRVVPASAPPPGLGRFDERPTSEAPRLPVMSTPQRPPAPAPSPGPGPASPAAAARTAPSAVAAKVAPFTPSVAAPAADEAQRRAPAGLFSSAPPAAPVAHETAQPSARRSRRTASHGTGPTDDAQTWRSVRASMLARAQRIGVTLTRAWKRLHPETRRWLGATLTASAAIALALHLAHLRTGASGEVAGAQRRPAASGSERDVRATAAVAVPVAVHAADPEPPIPTRTPIPIPTRTPIPIPIPTRTPTPTPTRTPISASSAPSDSLAAASSLELQRMLKLRARKPMHDAEPESATAIAAATGTAASAQLTVLPREPALEIKPAGPVEERATPTPSAPAEPAPPLQTTRMPADARDKSKSDTPAATKPQAVVPLAAHVRTSDLVVHGSVATSVVRRAIERMTSELQGCYARAAVSAGRNAFGTSHVEIEIDEHGRARDAHAHGSALPGLDACVAQSARNLVADRPPDTGRVQASFELAFTP